MKRKKIVIGTVAACAIAALVLTALDYERGRPVKTIQLNPQTLLAIGQIDSRFLSYNIEMGAITGGQFWKPYASAVKPQNPTASAAVPSGLSISKFEYRPPLDLSNARLRALATALGPAYVRISGTWANFVYFQDNSDPALAKPPAGFGSVLTRAEWGGVVDFAQAVNAKILTSFAISTGVRDAAGTWTPSEAGPLLAYTRSIGGSIYAAELFNEPNLSSYGHGPGKYDASWFAGDEAAFRAFVSAAAPNMKIVGPGDVVLTAHTSLPGGIPTKALMTAAPQPKFDIVSYHFYPAVSQRCAPSFLPIGASRGEALGDGWLSRTDHSFEEHKALRDQYDPGAPIWLTETGGAACGGTPWDATYLDSFRFLDQMGRLAKQGISVVFNQTLVNGDYGMIDADTLDPRPSYWAALLWRRLMGQTVLNAGPIQPGLHVYAQCLLGEPGGVSILAMNLDTAAAIIDVSAPADLYTLTAPSLQSSVVLLNGQQLVLGQDNQLPVFKPIALTAGKIVLAPVSINFITLPEAKNHNCLP